MPTSPADLINRTCWITRRSESDDTDDFGNEIPTETVTQSVCEVQQQRREEPGDEGELSDTTWVGFFLPTEVLNSGDSVSVEGIGSFELVGDPWTARWPDAQVDSHVEATLRRTEGPADGS